MQYTIDLDKNFDAKLAALADQKGTLKAEIIKRALATYSFLSDQIFKNPSGKVSITMGDDGVLKDIIIP